jgi:threonine dehydrogenase-like Zn-dependent dehydrogenase
MSSTVTRPSARGARSRAGGFLMAKMKAVQVSKPNGPFEVVSRDVRDPGPSEIRIRVEACGACHSDAVTKGGAHPGAPEAFAQAVVEADGY